MSDVFKSFDLCLGTNGEVLYAGGAILQHVDGSRTMWFDQKNGKQVKMFSGVGLLFGLLSCHVFFVCFDWYVWCRRWWKL